MKHLKKNTLKRIFSTVLLVTVIGTTLTAFSGCGIFAKKITGTEAAKVLLARERLDSDTVGQKTAIMSSAATAATSPSGIAGFFENIFPFASVGSIGASPMVRSMSRIANVAPGVTLSDSTVVWKDFKKTSDIKTSYTQFIDPIDMAAADTAELIATIKEDVGITDKWVDTLLAKYMLIVDENSETIIEYYKPFKSVSVSTRYTRDDAKCVYEMYSFMSYDDGTTGDIRNKCIPGEYYEYAYQNSGGFIDYFIADKSHGYWIMNRFQIREGENSAYFEMSAVKDGIGFGTSISAYEEDGRLVSNPDRISVSMFLPDDDVDIFEISAAPDRSRITLFMSNVESGIDSLSTSRSDVWEEQYGGSGMVYLYNNGGTPTGTVKVHLSNGSTLSSGDRKDTVVYEDSSISYSPEYHYDAYVGRLTFSVEGSSDEEVFNNFYSYLDSNGIKLRVGKDKVREAFELSKQLNENFDVMNWYGLRFDRLSNLFEGERLLKEDFARYRALYEEVKNNDTVSGMQRFSSPAQFGKMSIRSMGESTYADGIISINGLSAVSESTELLENGKAYTLKVGLALRGADGSISSVNTVSLESKDQQSVVYEGGSLELTQSADFIVPTAMSEGNYVVVIYFATADEGIRVTEMFPVAFFSAKEGRLESDVMDITVTRSGDNLFIDYAVKLSETTTADIVKEQYTYEEIEKVLIRGILAKGYPIGDAVVQTADGAALAADGIYGAGTYRLKFRVNTSEGLVEAYMYCTFEAK